MLDPQLEGIGAFDDLSQEQFNEVVARVYSDNVGDTFETSGTSPTEEQQDKAWQRFNKDIDKQEAYRVYNRALKDGELVKQPCEVCGTANTHGHHEDYDKPLDVKWLCPKHHAARHKELGWGYGGKTGAGGRSRSEAKAAAARANLAKANAVRTRAKEQGFREALGGRPKKAKQAPTLVGTLAILP